MINKIHLGDCLEVMKDIPTASIDMILADLPYQVSSIEWDEIIPFNYLWEQYERVIKEKGVIALTSQQPFTSQLVMSNVPMFKYNWVWKKTRPNGAMLANKRPLKDHEDILVFYKRFGTYNPQMSEVERVTEKSRQINSGEIYQRKTKLKRTYDNKGLAYPRTIKEVKNPNNNSLHPTQKPVALFEYLIKTYTNENETVLDNVIGSGTTAISCMNTNRNFIGIEKEKEYVDIANKRIKEHRQQISLF